jgi:hypothetical protein
MPNLIIEELNNKVEVKAETKAVKRIARAFKKISRYN